LTPILQGCGDLFDVVAIHRYPFKFQASNTRCGKRRRDDIRYFLTSVRSLVQATGYGNKPLAITEMNIALRFYGLPVGGSPGRLARPCGWPTCWGPPSTTTSGRPPYGYRRQRSVGSWPCWRLLCIRTSEYYAYQLYADHFGPTLVEVTQSPTNVRALPAATKRTMRPISSSSIGARCPRPGLSGDGAGCGASPATYTVPGLSISAVDIPDQGAATAWTTATSSIRPVRGRLHSHPGDCRDRRWPSQVGQRLRRRCIFRLSEGRASEPGDTTMGTTSGSTLVFGTAPYQWQSYTYGSNGQAARPPR